MSGKFVSDDNLAVYDSLIKDYIVEHGGGYELPTASTSELGGVKIDGTTITINQNGVISSSGGGGGGYNAVYAETSMNLGRKAETTVGTNSVVNGFDSIASSAYSHAEGYETSATGARSHAEGANTSASGEVSHAEGQNTRAIGQANHAEGSASRAIGIAAHAEGSYTSAFGTDSHAEGEATYAMEFASHAEGNGTTAGGDYSHAEGQYTYTGNGYSHAEGGDTSAEGYYSHAEGWGTLVDGVAAYAHAEGRNTTAAEWSAHAEGEYTIASGEGSHAEGEMTTAFGSYAHAEGSCTYACQNYQHVMGIYNNNKLDTFFEIGNGDFGAEANIFEVYDNGSISQDDGTTKFRFTSYNNQDGYYDSSNVFHAFGTGTTVPTASTSTLGVVKIDGTTITIDQNGTISSSGGSGFNDVYEENYVNLGRKTGSIKGTKSVAVGNNVIATDYYSHAEGVETSATAQGAHAEGLNTSASGIYAHAEGGGTRAIGVKSHAEGQFSTAIGDSAHVEGSGTQGYGQFSHAEGSGTYAVGIASHAEGGDTTALGNGSHAEGYKTYAGYDSQTIMGILNDNKSTTLFEIGNGVEGSTPALNTYNNAFEVYNNGFISQDNGATKFKFTQNNNQDGYYDSSNVFHAFSSGGGSANAVEWSDNTVLGAKNFCPIFTTRTRYGAVFTTDSEGCVHVSGTATQQTENQVEFLLKKGTYIVSGAPTGSTSGAYDIYIQKGSPATTIARSYDGSTMTQFTLDSDTTIKVNCRVPSGALDTTKIFKPMIRLATDTDNTYAPYAMTNKELTDAVNTGGGGGGSSINYSLNEQDTGITWIDGRHIYQQTFTTTVDQPSDLHSYPYGITIYTNTDWDKVIDIEGFLCDTYGLCFPLTQVVYLKHAEDYGITFDGYLTICDTYTINQKGVIEITLGEDTFTNKQGSTVYVTVRYVKPIV